MEFQVFSPIFTLPGLTSARTIINFKHFNDRSPIKIKAQLEEELHNKFYALIKPEERGQNVQFLCGKTNDEDEL